MGIKRFDIFGHSLEIRTSKDVFIPSPHGSQALASVIRVNGGEKVLDIGTGTGFLAILAAKMGGIVSATDILQNAVSLAKENFLLNQVSVDVRLGDIFTPFGEKQFDVIIANVPPRAPFSKNKRNMG